MRASAGKAVARAAMPKAWIKSEKGKGITTMEAGLSVTMPHPPRGDFQSRTKADSLNNARLIFSSSAVSVQNSDNDSVRF